MKRLFPIALLLIAGCSGEPKPAEPKKAVQEKAKDTAKSDMNTAVKESKKSIEEAAEAATRLVEEEARQEIEGYAPANASPPAP
jgi:outer membrane murein-binding lipoprotein Lpp